MKGVRNALFIGLICICTCIANQVNAQELHYRQGEVLVQLSDDAKPADILTNLRRSFDISNSGYTLTQVTSKPLNIWKLSTDFRVISELDIIQALASDASITNCQLNHLTKRRQVPNDPLFDQLYHYINTGQNSGVLDADYDAEEAWDLTTGGLTANGDEIVVAIIDDGLDGDHEDLIDNIWTNKDEIKDNGIDDDNNGYIDDYYGWDTDRDNPDIFDEGGHAVPLVGIIGAKGNNGLGVTGVNWDVKIMNIQGGGDEASTLAAYAYPYQFRKLYNETQGQRGAFVVATNSSFGINNLFPEDAPLWCAFYDSLGTVGILNCGATTNENTNVDEHGDIPTTCESEYFIGVTNLNNRGDKVIQAGYGKKSIDLAAFGEDILTTAIDNKYKTSSGTSEATPFVTGLIALMYSLECPLIADMALSDPAQSATIMKDVLLSSVQKVSSLEDLTTSGGRMNMKLSLDLLSQVCADCGIILSSEISDRTDTQAVISWVPGNDNTDFSLRWRRPGDNSWTTVNDVSSPYTLTGLNSCTDYEYQILSMCGSESSGYSNTFAFASEGCCELPTDIMYELSGSTAQFSWSSVFAAQDYLIEYKPITEAAWEREFIKENAFSLVLDQECSAYNFRMKVVCNGRETLYSDEVLVKSECGICSSEDYCRINNIDNAFEWIDSLVFAGQVSATGQDDSNQADYTNIRGFEVSHGDQIDLRIVPGFQTAAAQENFAMFIDWDQDARFDPEEEMFRATGSIPVDGEFTVPSNAQLGQTRMRVIMSFSRASQGCGASGFRFGEVEDYCIKVTEVPGECDIDSDLLVEDIKRNRATLKWTSNENVISYAIRYKQAAAEDWIEINEQVDSLVLTDLVKCTDYEAQIKTVCSSDSSPYSQSLFFKTKCTDSTDDLLAQRASISPNPFTNHIDIRFKESPANGELLLINLNGAVVKQKDTSHATSEYTLETEALTNGFYILSYKTANGSSSIKLVKI